MAAFRKILIANRGEIAIRVMRAANELGKRTVAVYAEEDKLGLHRFKADEAYRIGAGLGPVAAYLSIPEIIRVAKLGAPTRSIRAMGCFPRIPNWSTPASAPASPSSARAPRPCARSATRPARGAWRSRRACRSSRRPRFWATTWRDPPEAEAIGYPLMLKASHGGGGRGMRAIHGPEELEAKVREGRREAEAAFGNGEGYLEKMIQRARHVEVQLLGDGHGNLYHLYERDCTVQRRNQKVVERAPAPYLTRRSAPRSANWR
jgi:pyruvate carboxylase